MIEGDSLDLLAEIEPESAHAIVTDSEIARTCIADWSHMAVDGEGGVA